jgi:hypothetical protein
LTVQVRRGPGWGRWRDETLFSYLLNMRTPLSIKTSRYASSDLIVESGLAPVATSRGLPKFPIRYAIAAHLLELAPTWPMMRLAEDEFEADYLQQLERIGIEHVLGRLTEIAATSGTAGVVLLCFEPPDQPCHRHVLSRWITEQSGIEVHELPAPTEPPPQRLTLEDGT